MTRPFGIILHAMGWPSAIAFLGYCTHTWRAWVASASTSESWYKHRNVCNHFPCAWWLGMKTKDLNQSTNKDFLSNSTISKMTKPVYFTFLSFLQENPSPKKFLKRFNFTKKLVIISDARIERKCIVRGHHVVFCCFLSKYPGWWRGENSLNVGLLLWKWTRTASISTRNSWWLHSSMAIKERREKIPSLHRKWPGH